MIEINGKKFAETEQEFIDSLFHSPTTCVGYAKRNKRSIVFMTQNKIKVGVINRHGVLCCATIRDDGKYWYSFANIKLIGHVGYKEEQDLIDKLTIKKDSTGRYYK